MNCVKIYHFKNGDTVALNIKNQGLKEIIGNLELEQKTQFANNINSEEEIIVINMSEVNYVEIRTIY